MTKEEASETDKYILDPKRYGNPKKEVYAPMEFYNTTMVVKTFGGCMEKPYEDFVKVDPKVIENYNFINVWDMKVEDYRT